MTLTTNISLWIDCHIAQSFQISSWDSYFDRILKESEDNSLTFHPLCRSALDTLKEFRSIFSSSPIKSIRIGSEICPRLLPSVLQLESIIEISKATGTSVQLVIPPLAENEFIILKDLCNVLRVSPEVETTVNDLGSLAYLNASGLTKISAGRLLWKQKRITRLTVDELDLLGQDILEEYQIFENAKWLTEINLKTIEIDLLPQGLTIDSNSQNLAIHLPWSYIAYSRICTIGSLTLPPKEKFKIGAPCQMECKCIREIYQSNTETNGIMRYGKGIYGVSKIRDNFLSYLSSINTFIIDSTFLNCVSSDISGS